MNDNVDMVSVPRALLKRSADKLSDLGQAQLSEPLFRIINQADTLTEARKLLHEASIKLAEYRLAPVDEPRRKIIDFLERT